MSVWRETNLESQELVEREETAACRRALTFDLPHVGGVMAGVCPLNKRSKNSDDGAGVQLQSTQTASGTGPRPADVSIVREEAPPTAAPK